MCSKDVKEQRQILPTNVKPVHYHVEITPDLVAFKFHGAVKIELKVLEGTKTIICNANELDVLSASISNGTSTFICEKITLDSTLETVTLQFSEEFKKGEEIVLSIAFTGNHNDSMAGFYRSEYSSNGEKKFLVVTQFEATDCRRCFPSWDEPSLKATFDVILNVPAQLTALSNMPIIEEVMDSSNTLRRVVFERTPILSTYLVCFIVGEFEYLEAYSKPEGHDEIKCRVYTLPGQKEQGRFALGVCTQTLEFFTKYYGIPYMAPKMDMIAITNFGAGAMENLGCITYRETALLYDSSKSSAKAKERVAYVVAHELAHQWFGNRTTMSWWNELWLNEGFATFVGWLAVDHLFPEWSVFTSFVTGDYAAGMSLDALRSSHPVEVEVSSPHEIGQIFDAISYSKGASIIRMLSQHLGNDVFAAGITVYLKRHAYSNATTLDLWKALSEVSGQDVAALMYAWTRTVGYPMITVDDEAYDGEKKVMNLTLKQKRFLATGDTTADEEKSKWNIPIGITTGAATHILKLEEKSGLVTFPFAKDESAFYKLNAKVTGFYRVCYTSDQLNVLEQALLKDLSQFSTQDRIGIISDAFAFARAGLGSTVGALMILKAYRHEENQIVLEEIASRLSVLKRTWFQNKEVVHGLDQISLSIFSPKVHELGYEYKDGEDHMLALKRTLAIGCAAGSGDKAVILELQNLFKEYRNGNKQAFHPNLRGAVFKTVLNHSENPQADFDAIMAIYNSSESAFERISALSCIGATNSLDIAHHILKNITMNEDIVRLQDCMYPIASLATLCPLKVEVLEILWTWLTKNWKTLYVKLSPTLSLLGRVLSYCIDQNIGFDFSEKVEAWARGDGLSEIEQKERIKEVKAAKRPLDQSLEAMKGATTWFERDVELPRYLSKNVI